MELFLFSALYAVSLYQSTRCDPAFPNSSSQLLIILLKSLFIQWPRTGDTESEGPDLLFTFPLATTKGE